MKKLVVLFFVLFSFNQVFSQHLPLQIGNQWHYTPDLSGFNSVFIATDTVRIDETKYFRIDYWSIGFPYFYGYYFDRMEGDSVYYRIYPNRDSLFLFNFNWTNGQIISTPELDSCVSLQLILRNVSTYLGLSSDIYNSFGGFHCPWEPDTAWTISSRDYSRFFGGIRAENGTLIGALIDGISYGTLYPVPVELLSFSSSVFDNNVTLNWATATETNNSGFNVERKQVYSPQSSAGNEEWNTITFVNGNGTTTEPQSYSFKDENLSAGKYQYRLKQIDFDGTFEYSNIIEAEILPPAKFSLEQNYPNPFNPSTKISWQSPVNSWQTLKVFDILGIEVATLMNEYKPAGIYEVEFNASSLASGMYLYKLQAGSFVQTKKMILTK